MGSFPSKKANNNEEELDFLGEGSIRKRPTQQKISRSKTIGNTEALLLLAPEQEPRHQGEEQTDDQPRTNNPDNRKSRTGKLEHSLPRFGPCHVMDKPLMPDTKEIALEHVLKTTTPEDPSKARQIYSSAIRKVDKEAREIYGDEIKCSGPEFRSMMIKDGCFFLQLALLILGSPEQLGYPSNNLIFGRETDKIDDAKNWINAMFFVGNQIPMVVLKQLLDQKFFRDVIANGKWEPPSELTVCRMILYELLIIKPRSRQLDTASDVLHALHSFVMGPDPAMPMSSKKFGIYQMEDNNDEFVDLEAAKTDPDYFGDPRRNYNNNKDRRFFSSATDLHQSNIGIQKLNNGGGVKSIYFRSYYFWATLYLPVLPIHDEDVQVVFNNLKTYEAHHMHKNKREITSYLRLMSDIVQTSRDVKMLKRIGIIQGNLGEDDEDELPELLSSLNSSTEDISLTPDFRTLRRKMDDYSPPWGRLKSILNVVALLTLLQTFFTILAYFRPPNNYPPPSAGP